MIVFDSFKNKDIDELVEWLDEYCYFDRAPWLDWWDKNYCNNCDVEISYVSETNDELECAWCELNHRCKFFDEMDDIPDDKQIIKMWLLSEVEE